MDVQCENRLELSVAMRPAMIAYACLLQLPADGLDALVEHELADNPALERDEQFRQAAPRQPVENSLPVVECDSELLRRDARILLTPTDRPLVDYVLDSLDGRGRLTTSTTELASALAVDRDRIECALAAVRTVGPPGLGARDLRECLLLQLDAKPPGDPVVLTAREIIDRFLADLGAGRLAAIATALGRSTAEISQAAELIRTELKPFAPLDVGGWPPRTADARPSSRPDFVFSEDSRAPGGFAVQVTEAGRHPLLINPAYRAAGVRRDPLVREQLDRARGFLGRLQQRWQTMRAVGESVAVRQQAFLGAETDRPGPLTRAEIARSIGVHESTVSRVVADRWALLPSGRSIAMSEFFGFAIAAREAVREVVAQEIAPLSDSEIARMLCAAGHPVARRTVAKYRAQLGIAARSQR